jgi:Nuclear condensing complex subunits, C-term domain
MICSSWIRASHFNPIILLEWVNLLDNTAIASSILEVWVEAAKTLPSFVQDFSDRELRNFQHGLHDSIAQFSITDIDVSEKSTVDDVVGRLFVARNLLKFTKSANEKEAIWSHLIPDISELCQVLEMVVSQLVQVLATKTSNKDEESCYEDKITFICQELLLLSTIDVGESMSHLEEGSRRVLMGTIKNLLSNVVTPDDLLEGCVSALKDLGCSTDSDRFNVLLTQMLPVLDQIAKITETSDNELLSIHTSIRIQTLITLVLETQESAESLSADFVPNLIKYVRPAVSHDNVLLRQAAVRTMGLLGSAIAGTPKTLQDDDFTSTLLSIATNVNEGLEIRIQAMFALTDWSMLHFHDEFFFTNEQSVLVLLCEQIDAIFNDQNQCNLGTVCCVAEMATKLIVLFMLTGPSIDSFFQEKCRSWLARLVVLYFDSNRLDHEDENGDVYHIGSPVRLQQFLSSFFSAMTSTRPFMASNQYFLDAISPLLAILHKQQLRFAEASGKSKPSTVAVLLWTRSIGFIATTVVECRAALAKMPNTTQASLNVSEAFPGRPDIFSSTSAAEESSGSARDVVAPSPYLTASLQVARFLSQECSRINVAFRRGLCKSVASMMISVDISNEPWGDLFCLKQLLEELVENDGIDDGPCRRTLIPVLQVLFDVESDEGEENEDDEDVASLSDAFEKVEIDPEGSENIISSVSGKASKKFHNDPQVVLRRTRRLRTSN